MLPLDKSLAKMIWYKRCKDPQKLKEFNACALNIVLEWINHMFGVRVADFHPIVDSHPVQLSAVIQSGHQRTQKFPPPNVLLWLVDGTILLRVSQGPTRGWKRSSTHHQNSIIARPRANNILLNIHSCHKFVPPLAVLNISSARLLHFGVL